MKQKLKVSEYATKMRLSAPTVYRHIKAGKLETETIDGVSYVLVDEAEINCEDNSKEELNHTEQLQLEYHAITELKTCLENQQDKIEHLQNDMATIHQLINELRKQMPKDATEAQQHSDIIMLQRISLDKQQTNKPLEDTGLEHKIFCWFKRLFGFFRRLSVKL